MKYKFFLSVLLLITTLLSANSVEIWVSPNGDDQNPGTREEPIATVSLALWKIRELRRINCPSITSGATIILKGGEYQLKQPLYFRPEDSGTEQAPTLLKAADGELPVLSGGVEVTGWQRLGENYNEFPKEARAKLWVADIPKIGGHRLLFRQMWVNNRKADRASNLSDGDLDRILSADFENEIFWIPSPDFKLDNIGQLEFNIHQWWAIANLRVKDMVAVGDSVAVSFHQPESRIEFVHPWPPPFIDEEKDKGGNSAFYFSNAPQLLNTPGEWYADMNKGKVYYWPRDEEDMNYAKVVVPYLENVVVMQGTLDNRVEHIHFNGISFQHTSWLRPSLQGHVPLQAGMYINDAYTLNPKGTPDKASLCNLAWIGRQPAAVVLRAAAYNRIENCEFRHMAATGLDLEFATSHNVVLGNLFTDIGGTGIQIGFFGDDSFEAHMPYDPIDQREVCQYETIANNLISYVTNEDWGCVGISVGFARDINIEYNEVSHVNYSGICVGWGWTSTVNVMGNNRIHANHIHHFARMMYDVGGIYTLSAQPNTVISENAIHDLLKAPYAHIPDHFQYIYFDEGSSYIKAINNWTEEAVFFSNTPGPGNEWDNNGPDVDEAIRQAAGLQHDYRYLKQKLEQLR